MEATTDQVDALLCSGARRLTGYQRRLFQAEVTTELCGGSARLAERRFGWGRETVEKGLHESLKGVRCLENFAARGLGFCLEPVGASHRCARQRLQFSNVFGELARAFDHASIVSRFVDESPTFSAVSKHFSHVIRRSAALELPPRGRASSRAPRPAP